MPRQIKNDTPSNAQLQDLIRPIVKSEMRRRDGAVTSFPLDPNGGLAFSGSGLGIKLEPGIRFLREGAAGLGNNFLTSSDGSSNLTITVPTLTITDSSTFTVNAAGDVNVTSDADLFLTSNTGSVTFTANNAVDLSCSDTTWVITNGCSINAGTFTLSALGFGSLLINGAGGVTLQSSAANAVAQPLSLKSGSPTSGANSNAGTIVMRSGQPRGTGTSIILLQTTNNAGTVATHIKLDVNGIGFFGAVPVGRLGSYTITAAPAVSSALNADANGGAYTAIADTGATNLAAAADLNDLRADVASISAVLRQLVQNLGQNSGSGLISETGY